MSEWLGHTLIHMAPVLRKENIQSWSQFNFKKLSPKESKKVQYQDGTQRVKCISDKIFKQKETNSVYSTDKPLHLQWKAIG